MGYIVESQLARHRDGDFGGRKVAGVRNIHVLVLHAQLHAHLAVVAKYPDGRDYTHDPSFRVCNAFPYHGDTALIAYVNHLHISRIILVDSVRVFHSLTAAT